MNKFFRNAARRFGARVRGDGPRMPLSERILLYSRLSLYLRSGIPIRDALGFIRSSAKRDASLRILNEVEKAILHGTSLTRAFGAFPEAFPSFETHLVGIGERSGSLPENLAYLASLLGRRRALSRKIRGALVYPGVIVFGTVAVTGFLLLYTFPKIVPIFRGLNTPLPFTTRALIGVSDLVTEHGFLLPVVPCLAATLFAWCLRRPQARRRVERASLRSPVVGRLIRAYNLALISRTLSTLLSSGIPLIPALELVGNGIRHEEYREAVRRVGDRVNEGQRLSGELSGSPRLFPSTLIELVSAGESTGSLGQSLATCAELYEEELDEGTRTLATLIEPALMIAMGLLVGFIAMAIITPIYGITQNLTLR